LRKLHNKELHNLYFSSDTIRVIKSKIRWAGHSIEHMRKVRNAYKILAGNL